MTAEFAALTPAILLVLACCLGAVQLVGQHIRLTDAAAEGARSLARGDGLDLTSSRVHSLVGTATVSMSSHDGFVCMTVSAPAQFGPTTLLGMRISAHNCSLAGGV